MLILPTWLITSADEVPRRGWGVRLSGAQIADVAPHSLLCARYPGDPVWDAGDQVLAPGFVNAHMHLYGLLAHGIPLAQPPSGLYEFLRDFWWPRIEDRLDHEMIQAAAALQCARLLQSGVTSFYDCLEAPHALPGCLEAEARAVRRFGLRAVLSFEATERVSSENGQLGLEENCRFIRACSTQPGLVSGMMCLHTTFTCSAPFIRQAFELAEQLGTLVHLHCSEGMYEPEYALAHFGKRPIAYYDDLGVLGERMLASQCVQIDAPEIELLARRGVRIAHMPLSNCEVGGGIAPLPELAAARLRIGLGSDGYIDDMFDVMRGAFLIHKAARRDPGVIPARLVWHMATAGGAEALVLTGVGRIAAGWQADLQLIDARLPTPLAEHNLLEQLLLHRSASDVRATIVAGQVRMREGEIPGSSWPELRARAHAAAERLWG